MGTKISKRDRSGLGLLPLAPHGDGTRQPLRAVIVIILTLISVAAIAGCGSKPQPVHVTPTPGPRAVSAAAEAKAETERLMQESIRATVAAIVPTPEPASSIQTKVAEALATIQSTRKAESQQTPSQAARGAIPPTRERSPPPTPDIVKIALDRGIRLAEDGYYSAALKELERAQRLHRGRSEEAEIWLSKVQEALGNPEAALKHQQNALALREGASQPQATPVPTAAPETTVAAGQTEPTPTPLPTTRPTPTSTPTPSTDDSAQENLGTDPNHPSHTDPGAHKYAAVNPLEGSCKRSRQQAHQAHRPPERKVAEPEQAGDSREDGQPAVGSGRPFGDGGENHRATPLSLR